MSLFVSIAMAIFGISVLALGTGAYGLAYVTQCLTFDFSRPFFSSFKTKLYLANIFVVLLLALGVALIITAVLAPLLIMAGVSIIYAALVPLMGTFIVTQFSAIWILIWSPLETRVIGKRMAAIGITPAQIQVGIPIGISDPTKSSFRKMTLVEDDIGMLWITPDSLIYRGDSDWFDIPRDRFLGMERKADAGSVSALGGTVHIVLRFMTAEGQERQARLHPEACGTIGRQAKAMNTLAARLQEWIDQPAPAETVSNDEATAEPDRQHLS